MLSIKFSPLSFLRSLLIRSTRQVIQQGNVELSRIFLSHSFLINRFLRFNARGTAIRRLESTNVIFGCRLFKVTFHASLTKCRRKNFLDDRFTLSVLFPRRNAAIYRQFSHPPPPHSVSFLFL